jgi:hypothetical protein
MAINAIAAYGIFPHHTALPEIVHSLNQAGFNNEDICMMLPADHPIASTVRCASFFNTEKASDRSTAGTIGWLSEFGAVVIPTVGFFIRSQAYFHALMVAKDAQSFCGNAKALIGLGFSVEEAERCEDQLNHLGVLVYVSCAEVAKTFWAREVLWHTGAHVAATLAQHANFTASA